MSDKDVLVMTYGTLKRNKYNYVYMESAGGEFVDEVVSSDSAYQMVGVGYAFPGIIAGDKKFQGELFSVPVDGIVGVLDYLEGYPIMYDRGFINVESLDGSRKYQALVYYLAESFIKSERLCVEAPSLSLVNNVYSWN